MLPRIFSTHLRTSIFNKVLSSFTCYFSLKCHYSISHYPSSNTVNNKLSSTLLSKCSHLLDNQSDKFTVTTFSLTQLLLNISYVSPQICRKFLRVSRWKPEYMLELLLGFQFCTERFSLSLEVVQSLWEIFRRISEKNEGFKHFPRSCEIMAFMLVNVGMLKEVESLLSIVEVRGISMASDGVFSSLVEGYVNVGDLRRALLMYDRMKGLCLAPSLLCFRSLIGVLLKEGEVDGGISVFEDIIEAGFEFGDVEVKNMEKIVGLLCGDGRVREARKLLKKIVGVGWRVSPVILSEVANRYIEKKDFEELMCFFREMRCAPDVMVGNKIIYSMCRNFGIGRADSFLCELENLGFVPNEITFGIFIGWCCLDENMRAAFVYLSEILNRGLKPDRHSYNAIMCGLFKAGLPEHAREIFNEMTDNGVEPIFATFKVLLAGYSRARQFNEVNMMIREMVKYGLIILSPSENLISKAFTVLGLNPLTVKVKRDNDVKSFRTEFVDVLGNGLYLDTDIDEFDKNVTSVLEECFIPDFNLLVARQCDDKNVIEALLMVDEMRRWGQTLSISVLSGLLTLLCESYNHVKAIPALLDNDFQLFSKLDHGTLNSVISILSKNGFIDHCISLLCEMYRRNVPISNETYTSVLVALCKGGNTRDLLKFWHIAKKDDWSPVGDDFAFILESLCHKRMINEILELFEIMLPLNPGSSNQVVDVFIEKLSSAGLTAMGHIVVNELMQRDYELDHAIFSHLIRGYFVEKRFSKALILFDKILADKLPISTDVLLILIPKLCEVNRFKEAVTLKETGYRDHPTISSSLQSALITSSCKVGKVFEADALFREMLLENAHPSNEIFNAVIQGHCQLNDLKIAKELFCAMIKKNISLSVSSYRHLISLLLHKGMFHSARGLKSLMLVQNNTPYSIINNIFVYSIFRTGNKFFVDEFLDELEENKQQLDEAGYNFLINGFSVWKEMSRSIKFFNDMINKGFRPSNRSLRAVIQYLCRNGQVDNALLLINQVVSRGWILYPSVLYAILEGLFTNGNIHQADNFVAQSMEKGFSFGSDYYNVLIKKFCSYGMLEIAVSLLDQILKEKCIPESSSYDCVVQSFCGCKNLDNGMDFLSEMLHRNLKPSLGTWVMITQKLCKKGQTVEAEGVLSSMISVGETPTKEMYSSVIDRYRLEKNMLKASELLDRMQSHGYEPDFGIQWSVISSLSNSIHQKSDNDSEGFLSKLLVESGFPSDNAHTKLK